MNKHDFDKYRDFPLGSPGRRVYDSYHMSTQDYFNRYYSEPDLSGWHKIMIDIVDPLFDKNLRSKALSNIQLYGKHFSVERLETFYSEQKSKGAFDDDILRFMSFLNGQDFFNHIKMSYEQWINAKNYANPHRSQAEYQDTIPLIDKTKFTYGMNAVRVELACIDLEKIR